MTKNFLIITEGEKTEINILEAVLKKYGFKVSPSKQIKIPNNADDFVFENTFELSKEEDNVIIAQGPRNRLSHFLKFIDKRSEDIDRCFGVLENTFAGIFLVYDVDHTLKDELEKMFLKYQDESTGMLLLSSPCIEILSDTERTDEIAVDHLSEYKAERNVWFDKNFHKSTEKYIIDNFEELALYYLKKNCDETGSKNVMEHPNLLLPKINELNARTYINDDYIPVVYRYFTTTVYVCIAYIKGLTKQIENSDEVIKFFESQKH